MTTALVVEDNILIREFVIDLLKMHGVIVQEAADGEEAVKKAQGSAYDLILMDINLPGMDGIEAARIIKKGQKDVLVIAVTAFAGKGDRERFLACGFDDYMPKPLEIPDFIKTLEKYCTLQKNTMDTQFAQKRFTALERIQKLLDPNSFVEIDGLAKHRCTDFGMEIKELPSDGVVTGFGTIDGKTIFVFSQDFTVMGGSIGEVHAEKICDVIDLAVKTYTGEDTTLGELGGAYVHGHISGLADFVAETEEDCLHRMRELLGLIMHPDSFFEDFEFDPHRLAESLINVIPDDPMKSYDMYKLIRGVVDHGYIFDIKHDFSPNMITCLVRMAGQTVGIVANQPDVLAGSIDVDAADKAARFIRFCDSFNIPLITFVDVPGFLPGVEQEHRGIIRHGAKMLFAYSEATVPKVTVIVRKAYGGSFLAMCSRDLGADVVLALPKAEIAVMGPEGAVNIIFRKEKEETRIERIKEYKNKFANPYYAASRKH
ncbi:MAG: response regulator, partial [Euryarchaeota archaeon]|nr:response regulator [Euryarchaeota archaeon]